jgi:uncharacterized protein YmfQ (DUF2313 family)
LSFGRWGRWPFKFGSTQQAPTKVAYRAMLDTLEPAFDSTTGTVHEIETFAYARIEGMSWGAGQRLSNQAQPAKMLEALADWETILELTPAAGTTDNARRAAVAAKQRGLIGNSLVDIEDVCEAAMGANFDALVTVAEEDVAEYWAGGTPGPPGAEWSSNVATIAVRVNKTGLNEADFLAKVGRLREQLEDLLPSWMTLTIGTGSSFIVGADIVGQDLL